MLSREEIQHHIPHRPPFLWLDEVVELTETSIVAKKELPADLEVFQGHYPSFPVLPGVLQCEACFQAGALLIAQTVPVSEGEVPVVTRLNNTKFRRMVRPGETLQIEVQLTERLSNAFYLSGKTLVDGRTAVRLEFVCASAPIG